jgi:hypothetical protein
VRVGRAPACRPGSNTCARAFCPSSGACGRPSEPALALVMHKTSSPPYKLPILCGGHRILPTGCRDMEPGNPVCLTAQTRGKSKVLSCLRLASQCHLLAKLSQPFLFLIKYTSIFIIGSSHNFKFFIPFPYFLEFCSWGSLRVFIRVTTFLPF